MAQTGRADFNPLPRERENHGQVVTFNAVLISIHSLVRGRTSARVTVKSAGGLYFNPLPRERENVNKDNYWLLKKISIHSLVRGRTTLLNWLTKDGVISIHSLVRGRTRRSQPQCI